MGSVSAIRWGLALATSVTVGTSAHAQEVPALESLTGNRVRLLAPTVGGSRALQGTVLEVTDGVLFLSPDPPLRIPVPLPAVTAIQVSVARGSRWKLGALLGAPLIGFPMVGVSGMAFHCPVDEEDCLSDSEVAGLVVLGLAGGALTGAFIGHQFKTDVWMDVPFDPAGLRNEAEVGAEASPEVMRPRTGGDEQVDLPRLDPFRRRNPTTAGLLSAFVPGTGQFYNGEKAKGFLFLGGIVAWAALSEGTGNPDCSDETPGTPCEKLSSLEGAAWLALMAGSVVDAVRSAKRINRESERTSLEFLPARDIRKGRGIGSGSAVEFALVRWSP